MFQGQTQVRRRGRHWIAGTPAEPGDSFGIPWQKLCFHLENYAIVLQSGGPPRAILDRFCKVRGLDLLAACQVRDGARQLEDAMEGPRAHP